MKRTGKAMMDSTRSRFFQSGRMFKAWKLSMVTLSAASYIVITTNIRSEIIEKVLATVRNFVDLTYKNGETRTHPMVIWNHLVVRIP